jgi:hypothetical protein
MSTSLDLLDDNFCICPDEINNKVTNLSETILDLEQDLSIRMNALDIYSNMENTDILELLSRIVGMYQMSGIKTVEIYLYEICTVSSLPSILKLTAVKALIEYKELIDEDEDTEDDIIRITRLNMDRSDRSRIALECICNKMDDLPTPCRVEAIELLMSYTESKIKASEYFISLITDINIECEFRYKTILRIERLSEIWIKDKLLTLFQTDFVGKLFDICKSKIKSGFPGFKPSVDNYNFFELVVLGLSHNICSTLYKEYFIEECVYDFFICNSQYAFTFFPGNMIYYKILSGQYLLQKCNISEDMSMMVENEVLSFAEDQELDYNRRADAADVLLQLGSQHIKYRAREIINELGMADRNGINTIFSNAQNVHTTEIEESVCEILEFFAIFPILMIENKPIDFEYIQKKIKDNMRKERPKDLDNHPTQKETKIILSLDRIYMDRVLYSKFNNTLSNILVKVWSYITGHEHEEEMYKRLLEELEEMSGTCSTGFVSRMVNVVCGFGEFSIRISWDDQIIANFSGRLNNAAKKITDSDSIFRNRHLESVVDLWLQLPEQQNDRESMLTYLYNKDPKVQITVKDLVTEYLLEDRDEKIENALDNFSAEVLNEMSINTVESDKRRNFSLFFRSSISVIREEMYEEFKDHLDDTSFDLYIRKAIMHYEGIFP